MSRPLPPKKKCGVQIRGRVATIQAALFLMQKPYKAVELAQELGMHIRITYRILNDLKNTGWLYSHRCHHWLDPYKNNNLEHLIPKTQTPNP